MIKKKAIVVGCTGQDGTLLYGHLVNLGYSVLGLASGKTLTNHAPWAGIKADITAAAEIAGAVAAVMPDEIYHLAAFHNSSQDQITEDGDFIRRTFEVNFFSLMNCLEAVRVTAPAARLFYAASAHIFGSPAEHPQDEHTPVNPGNIYGMAKAAGLQLCRFYRRRYGIFASAGILYNHESVLRDEKFVTKKIAKGVALIKKGHRDKLTLGDMDAVKDWGYAPDYVKAMHLMLQVVAPDDFIVATGAGHTVREFARIAFQCAGLDYEKFVTSDPSLVSKQAAVLIGNPARLKEATGWRPTVPFGEMVEILVRHELDGL